MYEELINTLRKMRDVSTGLSALLPKSGGDVVANLYGEAADAIEELSKPRWIPVTERLPDGEVLAINALKGSYGYHEYRVGYVDESCESETGSLCESDGVVLNNVTHWMPLPTPPKE